MKSVWFTLAALWALCSLCFIDTKQLSLQLHKTFCWLNGKEIDAHIRICWFSLVESTGFQGEEVDGKCVCVYLCAHRGEGPLLRRDSSAWIKCGTLIWVKIMESYMSLDMSGFHSGPKWKVTVSRDRGGGQRCRNGIRATAGSSSWLTRSQAAPGLAVIDIKELKISICSLSVFVYLSVHGTAA